MSVPRNTLVAGFVLTLLLVPSYWANGLAGPVDAAAAGPAAPAAGQPDDEEGIEFFEEKIRPLFAARCFGCHSSTVQPLQGNLRLDSREGVRKGGNSGPALVPGDPEKSLLIRAVRQTDARLKMPPGRPLSAEEVADLETWVKMGAPDPRRGGVLPAAPSTYNFARERQSWAFRALRQSPVPRVRDTRWPATPIDRFILAKLEAKGLKPAREADRRTLIRRVTFDLTGLPPTPEEVRAFLADRTPGAWEKVVDRLLASPHYGERWGRHWLDVVRYADTSGCNSDFPVPTAYKYRNYVIHAFNRDRPYGRFLQEQIAGDLLPAGSLDERHERIIATGYLAISRRFASNINEFHHTLDDSIDNLGKTVLGLSVSCARCHDHKYDPIPQRDYYALYGILQSSKYAFPGVEVVPGEKDLVYLGSPEEVAAAQKYDAELNELGPRIFRLRRDVRVLEAAADEAARKAKDAAERQGASGGTSDLDATALAAEAARARRAYEEARDDLQRSTTRQQELLDSPPAVSKAYAVSEGMPSNARIQIKGDPRNTGDEVPRGFLQILGGQKLPTEVKGSGRLELARWLTDPANPLTPRVMANRIWTWHFGRGIVATPSDFGRRGQKPSHPELLDYLALRFVRGGWSLKQLHRQILLSRVYRLSSAHIPRNLAADPTNTLLWRFNRRRLSAEETRDAMLAVSGTLDRTMGGEHPFPPRREWKYTQHRPFYAVYETNRRSVYLMQQRIRPHPFLETFDGADPRSNTPQRGVSTTAIQALLLMNNEFVHAQARRLAERLTAELAAEPRSGDPGALAQPPKPKIQKPESKIQNPKSKIERVYWLAFGRAPAPREVKCCEEYLSASRAEMASARVKPEDVEMAALASLMRVILSSNEFVFLD